MKAITGIIESVTVLPGRTDYIRVNFTPENSFVKRASFSLAEDADVTIDGEPCTSVSDLFEWLTTTDYGALVTVHPCPERYELSLKTEFRAAPAA